MSEKNTSRHKKLRNHIRKLKRKAKRQLQAKLRDEQDGQEGDNSGTDSSLEELKRNIEAENARNHQLWLEAERLADQKWKWMKAKEERDRQKKLEVEKQIRDEWEERMRIEEEEKEKKEKLEKEKKEKQDALLKEATANERKGSEAWHNPLAPVVYGEVKEVQKCPFFAKTATCRFAERCSRRHDYPESSNVILIPGMFTHFELDQGLTDEYESDLILEYEEGEIYNCFQEFYSDVLPELKSVGKVVQFKVCCNYEFHLRGNVYVQFEKEEDALKAYGVFNGRYYAGKQLSCQFVNIPKWRSAICGLFHQRRCPKGKICNFIHAFRNPKNEFWQADKDMEHVPPQRRSHKEYFNNYHHRYPINRQRRRSYSRERSRSRSRSRYESRRSYSRERSRSRSRSRYESRSRYGERRRQRRDYHSYSRRSRRRSYSSDSSDYSRNRRRRRSYSSDTSQSSSDSHISKNTSRSNHKKSSFDKSKQKHKHHKHNSSSSSNSDISDTEHKKEVQKSHDQTKSSVTDRHDLLDIPLPVSDRVDDSRTVQLDTDVNSERKNNADGCDAKQTATEGNDNTSNVPGETFHREHSSPSSKRRSRSRSRSSHRKHKRSRSRSKKRKHKSKSSKKHKKHSH